MTYGDAPNPFAGGEQYLSYIPPRIPLEIPPFVQAGPAPTPPFGLIPMNGMGSGPGGIGAGAGAALGKLGTGVLADIFSKDSAIRGGVADMWESGQNLFSSPTPAEIPPEVVAPSYAQPGIAAPEYDFGYTGPGTDPMLAAPDLSAGLDPSLLTEPVLDASLLTEPEVLGSLGETGALSGIGEWFGGLFGGG